MADLAAVAAVEKACFPPAEAATADEFRDRLAHYAAHFWLLFDEKGDLPCLRAAAMAMPGSSWKRPLPTPGSRDDRAWS